MEKYLFMIIASAVVTAVSNVLVPDRWQKFLHVVTGIMIVSTIIAPFSDIDLNNVSYTPESVFAIDMDLQKKAVCSELEKRVSADAVDRVFQKTGENCKIAVKLSINENNEIMGVEEMTVWAKNEREKIKTILEEVYYPSKILFQ